MRHFNEQHYVMSLLSLLFVPLHQRRIPSRRQTLILCTIPYRIPAEAPLPRSACDQRGVSKGISRLRGTKTAKPIIVIRTLQFYIKVHTTRIWTRSTITWVIMVDASCIKTVWTYCLLLGLSDKLQTLRSNCQLCWEAMTRVELKTGFDPLLAPENTINQR